MFDKQVDEILSEKVLIERLNVSRTTLWRWRSQGKLACFKLGSKVAYSEKHVRELLEKCERQAIPKKKRGL
jgi:predicted site-specific integrase-resolvase